ncbi:MAG: AAA family ATPase [Ktedonobacteraceae bacterium]
MKVTVHNLGVLKEAQVDIKPLTVFVGPNNAGKTWLAYTLAGIFGPIGFTEYLQRFEETSLTYTPLENAIDALLNKGSASIDLVQFAKEYGPRYFNDIAKSARNWIPYFMGTKAVSFDKLDISIDLAESENNFLERVTNYALRSQMPAIQAGSSLSIRKDRGETKLYAYISTQYSSSDDTLLEEPGAEQLPIYLIKNFVVQSILEILHRSLYSQVLILPTERTTFITFPFSGIRERDMAKQLEVAEGSIQGRGSKLMSGPVNHFLYMIDTVLDDETKERIEKERAKLAKSSPRIAKYIQLARLLEKNIMGGEVNFSQPEVSGPGATREVMFQPNVHSKLEISVASSMVKELSPLVLYLRYLARPGELLIIDEPEMNLHPEAQVKMIELLSMLINTDLNILITTHSPYVIDHLTNLIKAYDAEDKETVRREFYLKRTDAFISKENVSVYLIDKSKATKAIDEDGVIELNTFGEVSDRISDIYFTL